MEEQINRRSIIDKVIIDCLDELYRSSQPSITWKEVEEIGKQYPRRHIWAEHYIPNERYTEIVDKYLSAYNIVSSWNDDVDLVKRYLKEGGRKDKYIPERIDENGDKHPGYRGYEEVPPILKQIQQILKDEIGEEYVGVSNKITECVFNTISDCQNFYVKNRDELQFRLNVSNYAPSSSYENVRDLWEDLDPTVEIKKLKRIYNDDIEDYEWVEDIEK